MKTMGKLIILKEENNFKRTKKKITDEKFEIDLFPKMKIPRVGYHWYILCSV